MNHKIRLIVDPPRRGTLNMAIDEMLMENLKTETPILRFYKWDEPCVTIGYFQAVSAVRRLLLSRGRELSIVRRITGGGLVFHGEDLTFSFITKHPSRYLPTETKASYLKINEAVRTGLKSILEKIDYADCKTVPTGRAIGERICFERASCYDLLLNGKKILGASQRRRNGALLHQASLQSAGDSDSFISSIAKGFEQSWKIDFIFENLSDTEVALAEKIEVERYSSSDWVFKVDIEKYGSYDETRCVDQFS